MFQVIFFLTVFFSATSVCVITSRSLPPSSSSAPLTREGRRYCTPSDAAVLTPSVWRSQVAGSGLFFFNLEVMMMNWGD